MIPRDLSLPSRTATCYAERFVRICATPLLPAASLWGVSPPGAALYLIKNPNELTLAPTLLPSYSP